MLYIVAYGMQFYLFVLKLNRYFWAYLTLFWKSYFSFINKKIIKPVGG